MSYHRGTSTVSRDTHAVVSEPGLFPTIYLKLVLSQRACTPRTPVSLRVEGTDAGSLTRGKLVQVERDDDGAWRVVGTVVCAGPRSPNSLSRFLPNEGPPFAVTLEGYPGTMPMQFDVPSIPAGDYRLRVDLIHSNGALGDLRHRTATLYAPLRILASP
jgi:hypothetical protein